VTTRALSGQADYIRYQAAQPRHLKGVHALWNLDEPSIIAIPDAVQRGWSAETVQETAPLGTPLLDAKADARGNWHLAWTSVDPDARYVLEQAETADFAAPVVRLNDKTRELDVSGDSPAHLWFRVRAYVPMANDASAAQSFEIRAPEAAGSFWSDPVEVVIPPPQFADCPPGALGTPTLQLDAAPDASGSYRLFWTAVSSALRYVVQESDTLDFTDPRVMYMGAERQLMVFGRAPGRYLYRVRAEGSVAELGAVLIIDDHAAIVDVDHVAGVRHVVLASYVGAIGDEVVFDGDRFTERFGVASRRSIMADGFRYSLSRDDAWPGAPTFRAFVLDDAGAWSNGIGVTVPRPARRVLATPQAYDRGARTTLLQLHKALMQLAAARGDCLAVLALPEHYRESDAVRHVTALRSEFSEPDAWSYGALYHPWLVSEAAATGLLRSPPDGAICGMMAARAAARGAWLAPANQPLGDVLGLAPALQPELWQRLYDAQVNLIWQAPHGFIAMGADTLSLDPDLTPINVRRLLSLLRRLALQVGASFAFEPHGPVLRRSVERRFEALLDDMYRAGAFAGKTRSDAFQVVVDSALNREADAEQGRLVVELKVAPSLPLSFLTVRLIQNGARGTVMESA
jgi:hypothetical protein